MSTETQECSCGKPAHPLYGSRCEDCWVEGQSHHLVDGDYRRLVERLKRQATKDVSWNLSSL